MTKWNFTVVGGSLIKKLDETNPVVSSRSKSYTAPKFDMVGSTIYIYEQGEYDSALQFSQLGTIDGDTPTDLQDAYNKLIALIPTSSGGGSSSNYNNVTAYDEDATLPLTFATNTINSISIVAKTGTTTITIGAETTVLIEGQTTTMSADALIVEVISIDSTTGTFLATTLD